MYEEIETEKKILLYLLYIVEKYRYRIVFGFVEF